MQVTKALPLGFCLHLLPEKASATFLNRALRSGAVRGFSLCAWGWRLSLGRINHIKRAVLIKQVEAAEKGEHSK